MDEYDRIIAGMADEDINAILKALARKDCRGDDEAVDTALGFCEDPDYVDGVLERIVQYKPYLKK